MPTVVDILLCIAVILIGAMMDKPPRWVVVGLGFIALLLAVLGGFSVHVGR